MNRRLGFYRTAALPALLLCLLTSWAGGQVPQEAAAYEIKAAYLYQFLLFVSLKPSADAVSRSEVITIGIIGEGPMNEAFAEVEGKPVGSIGKRLAIKRFGSYREGLDLSGLQILFITSSESRQHRQILTDPSLRGQPVLTVADGAGFLEACGMILFVTEGDSVRWKINMTPVESAELKLNLQLLTLAEKVIWGPACKEADPGATRSKQDQETE